MRVSKLVKSIWLYVTLLTLLWAFFECCYFIQATPFKLTDFAFVSHKLQLPVTIIPGVLFFFFSQALLHLSLIVVVSVATIAVLDLAPALKPHWLMVVISVWLIAILWLLLANAIYYPNSKFADLIHFILPTPLLAEIFLALLSVGWLFFSLATVLMLLKHYKWLVSLTVGGLSVFVFANMMTVSPLPIIDAGSAAKPNIIIIGMDSLRPDFLSFFGGKADTPFLDNFLKHATVFDEASTPLARTFPSWSALLLSQYPRESGIRSNLVDTAQVSLQQSLPALLQQAGYETAFATDEVRFSNIDSRFGFQHLIIPPIGLNDFLLGTLNDFPLSNLVINTPLGKWLFPYSYANRPVFETYDPQTFNGRLTQFLTHNRTRPLFMVVHFCLPHFPYLWRDTVSADMPTRNRYAASLKRVDTQVADLYTSLLKTHALDHAVLILLSDHGEALGLAGDRITSAAHFVASPSLRRFPHFYPPSIDGEAVDASAGHGTDVLSFSQNHTLLAWQSSGLAESFSAKAVHGPASLLDIKPTVLSILNIVGQSSGMSLKEQLLGSVQLIPTSRKLYFESDYSPAALRSVYPKARHLVLEGVDLFHLDDKSTRLTIRPDMLTMIINSKQLAIRQGDWVLAFYPQNKTHAMPVLVNLKTKAWTCDLSSAFAKQAPLHSLVKDLNGFFYSHA